ncbi:hypothetical protein Tco_0375367 [Tanacetum coccineum]
MYMRCSMDELRCYRYTLDVKQRSRDAIVVDEMFNGGVEMLSCSTDESRCYRYTLDVQQRSQDAIVVHEMFNEGVEMLSCSTDESRCYRYTLDVQQRSRDAIVVHKMFHKGVEMGCEREDVEARIGSFDMENDCLIRLSWAHVHSKCLEDVQLTITMFEGTSIERNIDALTQVCCEAALRKEFKDWMLACEAILKSQLE